MRDNQGESKDEPRTLERSSNASQAKQSSRASAVSEAANVKVSSTHIHEAVSEAAKRSSEAMRDNQGESKDRPKEVKLSGKQRSDKAEQRERKHRASASAAQW